MSPSGSAKWAPKRILAAILKFGAQLGRFWAGFGRVLGTILEAFWHMGGIVKSMVFLRVLDTFCGLGGSWRGSWKLCLTMSGPSRIREGSKSILFAKIGDLGGHLDAKMAT